MSAILKEMACWKPMGWPNWIALLGVGHGRFIGPLGDAQRLGRDADAAAVQGGHGDLEALALLAQQVLLGHFHIVKDQLGSGGGADAHFVVVVAEGRSPSSPSPR